MMEKFKRFAAQFGVFMFWSAVVTAIGLMVAHLAKHDSLPPAWRWWDVLGLSVISAAIIMTAKSVFKWADNLRFLAGLGIFTFWFYGLFFSQTSAWIFGQKFGSALIGLFPLFLIPGGLGIILIMVFGHKNLGKSAERAAVWLVASTWTIMLIFVFSLAVAKGFYFVAPHLGSIIGHALAAAIIVMLLIPVMLVLIFSVKGLAALHRTAFKKELRIKN